MTKSFTLQRLFAAITILSVLPFSAFPVFAFEREEAAVSVPAEVEMVVETPAEIPAPISMERDRTEEESRPVEEAEEAPLAEISETFEADPALTPSEESTSSPVCTAMCSEAPTLALPADPVLEVRLGGGGTSAGSASALPFSPVEPLPKSISGNVFIDSNMNAVKDGGEAGVEGFAVRLYDSSDVLLTESLTNANGNYHFSDLSSGTYAVEVVLPNNAWQQTFPSESGSHEIVLSGAGFTDAHFGVSKLSTISGYLWHDFNNDGVWQTDGDFPEPPLSGKALTAHPITSFVSFPSGVGSGVDAGAFLGSHSATPDSLEFDEVSGLADTSFPGKQAVTDADGFYMFAFAPHEAGDWRVSYAPDAGWEITAPAAGSYDVEMPSSFTEVMDRNFATNKLYHVLDVSLSPLNGDPHAATSVLVVEGGVIVLPSGSVIIIPTGTVITSAAGPFAIAGLTAADIAGNDVSGFSAGALFTSGVQWGISGLELLLSEPLAITIAVSGGAEGEVLDIVRSTAADSGWTADGITAPATCTVSGGACTFTAHKASYFSLTEPAPAPPTPPSSNNQSGGGGGGGGGSSVVVATPLPPAPEESPAGDASSETQAFPSVALLASGSGNAVTVLSAAGTAEDGEAIVLEGGEEDVVLGAGNEEAPPAEGLAGAGFLASLRSILSFGTGNLWLALLGIIILLGLIWYTYRIFFSRRSAAARAMRG